MIYVLFNFLFVCSKHIDNQICSLPFSTLFLNSLNLTFSIENNVLCTRAYPMIASPFYKSKKKMHLNA